MSAIAGSPLARTRSRVATAHRLGSTVEITDARRDHAAAKLEDAVLRIVSSAPPLTPEQRDRIAALLRPTPSGGAAA